MPVLLYRKGIAWYTDKNVKFRNPPTNSTFTLQQAFEGRLYIIHHTFMNIRVCFSHCCLSVCFRHDSALILAACGL